MHHIPPLETIVMHHIPSTATTLLHDDTTFHHEDDTTAFHHGDDLDEKRSRHLENN